MVAKKAPAKKAAAKKVAAKKADTAPPSKPIEDRQVSENNTEELPQPVAKKPAKDDGKLSVDKVAELLLDGSRQWGTGSDRDANLVAAGYDLDEVRNAVTVARGKRMNPS